MVIILELIILTIVLAMNYIIPWLNLSYYSLKHGIITSRQKHISS